MPVPADRFAKAFARISRRVGANASARRPLAREVSLRAGGPAAIFVIADSLKHLGAVYETADLYELRLFMLGRGTNVLVSDAGFPGLVVRLGREFHQTSWDGSEARAGAAVSLAGLVQNAARRSLTGLEFAIGIPGSVGGALAMNAGAHGACIGDAVRRVIVYDRLHGIRALEPGDIRFGYRRSSLAGAGPILEAAFRFSPGEQRAIQAAMDRYFTERKSTQPLHVANAGCVFRNPVEGEKSAGRLIEEAGCKGFRVGAAEVSDRHANFIVNLGGATASEIYELLRRVQLRVFEASGTVLELEIELVGSFDGALLEPA